MLKSNDSRKVLHILHSRGMCNGFTMKKCADVKTLKDCVNELVEHHYITIGGNFGVLIEDEALGCYAATVPSRKWEIEQELKTLFRNRK